MEEFYQESDKSNINPEELPELSRQVYLYNIRCSDSYKIKALRENLDESGLYLYLNELVEDENYIIFLSVKDEAANSLDEKARESFAALGLTELSQLEFRDSYVGIIDGGEILVEKRSHEEGTLRAEYFEYGVVSGGADSGDISSIMIDGIEYSLNSRGMNIVVYNKVTKLIVDTITFDTYSYPVSIN